MSKVTIKTNYDVIEQYRVSNSEVNSICQKYASKIASISMPRHKTTQKILIKKGGKNSNRRFSIVFKTPWMTNREIQEYRNKIARM